MTKNNQQRKYLTVVKKEQVEVENKIIRRNTMPGLLYDLLTTPSPHPDESRVQNIILNNLPRNNKGEPIKNITYNKDKYGNIIVTVGPREKTTVMFSSHMDMIYVPSKLNKDFDFKKDNTLLYSRNSLNTEKDDNDDGYIWGGIPIRKEKSGVQIYEPCTLGADDKAGVYIMLEFIKAKIPGVYIFHVGEERGGIGSTQIVENTPDIVKGITKAIAFDRANYGDIIDTQRSIVCCSKDFVTGLATQLNDILKLPALKFSGATGSFTDTANYIGLISECTNLSVGYFNQHTCNEHLDVYWLTTFLLPTLLKVDWENIPVTRRITTHHVTSAYWKLNSHHNSGYRPPYHSPYSPPAKNLTAFKGVNMLTPEDKIPTWSLSADGYLEDVINHTVHNRIVAVALARSISSERKVNSYTSTQRRPLDKSTVVASDIPYCFTNSVVQAVKELAYSRTDNQKLREEIRQLKIKNKELEEAVKSTSSKAYLNTRQNLRNLPMGSNTVQDIEHMICLKMLSEHRAIISKNMLVLKNNNLGTRAKLLCRDLKLYCNVTSNTADISSIKHLIHAVLSESCVLLSKLKILVGDKNLVNDLFNLHHDAFTFLTKTWKWNDKSTSLTFFSIHHKHLMEQLENTMNRVAASNSDKTTY